LTSGDQKAGRRGAAQRITLAHLSQKLGELASVSLVMVSEDGAKATFICGA
jgi:hypothetical protein